MDRLSASQASKHVNCHASANLDLAIPHWVPPVLDPDADTAANRGTEMHRMFADIMSLPPSDAYKMAQAIDYVTTLRGQRRFKVLIESVVAAEWLTTKPPTCADLVLYTQDELHIIDLKTGKIPVFADDNEQLMYYAVTYGPLAPKAKGATLHIVQPWAGNYSNWYADSATLMAFMQRTQQAEKAIVAGSTMFSPGDHCKFCPANPQGRGAKGKPFCPAMMGLLYPQVGPDLSEMLSDEE